MSQPTGIEALVCADIAARQKLGIAKYGRTVAESSDDMLVHGYQEALDLAVYLKAEIEKRAPKVTSLRGVLEDALLDDWHNIHENKYPNIQRTRIVNAVTKAIGAAYGCALAGSWPDMERELSARLSLPAVPS